MPQSPRWVASFLQSLPVMLFGSNSICSCSKSSGGNLRPQESVFSEGRIKDSQSGFTHSQMPWALGRESRTPCRQQPKQPLPHLLHGGGWKTEGGAAQDSSSDAWNLRISMYLVSKPCTNRSARDTLRGQETSKQEAGEPTSTSHVIPQPVTQSYFTSRCSSTHTGPPPSASLTPEPSALSLCAEVFGTWDMKTK